jgi:enterochelin esterase-like enzyme
MFLAPMKAEEHVLKSIDGEYTRKAWLLRIGNVAPQKLCLVLDGEYYLDRMEMPSVLEELTETGVLPPMTCLFVSNENGEARHHDYTCNPRYARFVADDLFQWAKEQCDTLSNRDHLICGLSLSGLAGAHIALTYPQRFTRTLSQSGSFWWNSEWLRNHLPASAPGMGRFWISVGDKETNSGLIHAPTGMRQDIDQVTACAGFAEALKARGNPVHYSLHEGNHEITPWKAELAPALAWLFGKETS